MHLKDRSLLLIFFLALAVRFLYLWQSSAGPVYNIPVIDSGEYHQLAVSLLQGGPMDSRYFWQPVFYPAFLTAAYSIFGISMTAVKLLQCGVASLTCVLVYLLGIRLVSRKTGLIAGLILVFYGPSIFFAGELLAAVWAEFLFTLLMLLALNADRGPTGKGFFLWGLSGAVAILVRPTFLLPVIFISAWLVFRHWRLLRYKTLLLTAGFAIIAFPVAWKQHQEAGRFSILPSSGGINLFIGNNPDRCRTARIRPGYAWTRLVREPYQNGAASPAEGGKYFSAKVLQYALSQPLDFIRGLAVKSLQFINSAEPPRNLDVYLFREWSSLLRVLIWRIGIFGFPFGVLFPLAAAGCLLAGRRIPLFISASVILYAGSVILVFVSSRYRLPIIPILAVFAAAGLAEFPSAFRKSSVRTRVKIAVITAVSAAASLLPVFKCLDTTSFKSELYQSAGEYWYRRGNLSFAGAYLEQALDNDAENATAHYNLGLVRFDGGDYGSAAMHWKKTLDIFPDHQPALHNRIQALLKLADYSAAKKDILEYGGAGRVKMILETGQTLLGGGKPKEASTLFLAGLNIEPGSQLLLSALGEARLHEGLFQEAADVYRNAVGLYPEVSWFYFNLGSAQAGLSDYRQAAGSLEQAVRLSPGNAKFWYYLVDYRIRAGLRDPAQNALEQLKNIDMSWYEKAERLFGGR